MVVAAVEEAVATAVEEVAAPAAVPAEGPVAARVAEAGPVAPAAPVARAAKGGTGGTGGKGGTGGTGGGVPRPGGPTYLSPFNNPRNIVPSFPATASSNQQVLYELASGTGGFPILNTNDLLPGSGENLARAKSILFAGLHAGRIQGRQLPHAKSKLE